MKTSEPPKLETRGQSPDSLQGIKQLICKNVFVATIQMRGIWAFERSRPRQILKVNGGQTMVEDEPIPILAARIVLAIQVPVFARRGITDKHDLSTPLSDGFCCDH